MMRYLPRLLDFTIYFVTALVYLFALMPVVFVIIMAFNESRYFSLPITGLTFHWFGELFRNQAIMAALQTSTVLGLLAGGLATILGTAASLGLARYQLRYSGSIQMMMTLPILVPQVVLGVSLLLAFRIVGLSQSFGLLLAGHTLVAMPFVVLMTYHRLKAIPTSFEEAARTLGANYWQAFRQITLPLMMPAIVAASLFAFMSSFDELAATLFWRPANLETITTQVMSMLEDEISPEVNAVAVLLIVISVGLPLLGLGISRLLAKRRSVN